jgi:hypothetical protein
MGCWRNSVTLVVLLFVHIAVTAAGQTTIDMPPNKAFYIGKREMDFS